MADHDGDTGERAVFVLDRSSTSLVGTGVMDGRPTSDR